MENSIFTKPSYYASAINGFTVFVALILIFSNYSSLKKMDPFRIIILVILFGLLIGMHGLMHLGLENSYNYNPMEQMFL